VQELHRNERLAVLVVNLVDRADVRVVQSGSGTRLATESFECLRVAGKVVWQEFQGDEAMQLYVLSLVDNTHPAAAQLLDNAVVRDGLTDHGAQADMVGMT